MDKAEIASWKGSAEIWRATYWKLRFWPRCQMRLGVDTLEVELPIEKVTISPSDIVEIRLFRLPFPSLTVIFRTDDENALVSFFGGRASQIRKAFEESEFSSPENRFWRTGFEAGRDSKKYQLH